MYKKLEDFRGRFMVYTSTILIAGFAYFTTGLNFIDSRFDEGMKGIF